MSVALHRKEDKMRCFAMHDKLGKLAGLIISPPDSPAAGMSTESGLFLTEVDAPEELSEPAGPDREKKLNEILKSFRVDINVRPRLMKADAPKR
jgi:hypothetical protein